MSTSCLCIFNIRQPKEYNFIRDDRDLLKEGPLILTRLEKGALRDTEAYVILFNDNFVICEPSKKTLKERDRDMRRSVMSTHGGLKTSKSSESLLGGGTGNASPNTITPAATIHAPTTTKERYKVIDVIPVESLNARQQQLSAGSLEEALGISSFPSSLPFAYLHFFPPPPTTSSSSSAKKKDKKANDKIKHKPDLQFLNVDGQLFIVKRKKEDKKEDKKLTEGEKAQRQLEREKFYQNCTFELADTRDGGLEVLYFTTPSPEEKAVWVKQLNVAVGTESPYLASPRRSAAPTRTLSSPRGGGGGDANEGDTIAKANQSRRRARSRSVGDASAIKPTSLEEKEMGEKDREKEKEKEKGKGKGKHKGKEKDKKKKGGEDEKTQSGEKEVVVKPQSLLSPREQPPAATPSAGTTVEPPGGKRGGKEGFKWIPNPKGKGFIFVKDGPTPTPSNPTPSAEDSQSHPTPAEVRPRTLITRQPRQRDAEALKLITLKAPPKTTPAPPVATPVTPPLSPTANGGTPTTTRPNSKGVQMEKVKEVVDETIKSIQNNLDERRNHLLSLGDEVTMEVVVDLARRLRAVKKELGS